MCLYDIINLADFHHANSLDFWLQNYSFIQHIRPATLCSDIKSTNKTIFSWSHPSSRFTAWSRCSKQSESLWKKSIMITIEPPIKKRIDYCFELDTYASISKRTFGVPYVSWLHTNDEHVLQNIWEWPKQNIASIYASQHRQASKNTNYLREQIYKLCTSQWKCVAIPLNSTLQQIIHTYLNSTFCIQPQGDTPTRAGIFDSLASMCIPVFISGCEDRSVVMDTAYYPFLSKEFRKNGIGNWSISISIHEFQNLNKYLQSIPTTIVNKLRSNIRKQIDNFIYTYDGNKIIKTFEFDQMLVNKSSSAQKMPK